MAAAGDSTSRRTEMLNKVILAIMSYDSDNELQENERVLFLSCAGVYANKDFAARAVFDHMASQISDNCVDSFVETIVVAYGHALRTKRSLLHRARVLQQHHEAGTAPVTLRLSMPKSVLDEPAMFAAAPDAFNTAQSSIAAAQKAVVKAVARARAAEAAHARYQRPVRYDVLQSWLSSSFSSNGTDAAKGVSCMLQLRFYEDVWPAVLRALTHAEIVEELRQKPARPRVGTAQKRPGANASPAASVKADVPLQQATPATTDIKVPPA